MDRSLDALLEENKDVILDLKSRLLKIIRQEEESSFNIFDDVVLLRYALTGESVPQILENIQYALKWRSEHKDDIKKVKDTKVIPHEDLIKEF